MISFIICSRNSDIPQFLIDNIAETIGVEYELIVIDNSKNGYSIFSAYNEGVKRSVFPYLCFMHEDILYHTKNWGMKVIEHFGDEKVGLIGVIGGHFLPAAPAYWFESPYVTTTHIQTENGISVKENKDFFFQGNNIVDAVACDGFWICIRRSLFPKISFDENLFSGFHYYDMDICMQLVMLDYRVCICNDIIIEHFGGGNYDERFYKNQNIFFEKWKSYLPIHRGIQMPEYVMESINSYIVACISYKKEIDRIVNSKSYRLGKLFIQPFSSIKIKLKKNIEK